jgi:iron complex outermembrane recepter protein
MKEYSRSTYHPTIKLSLCAAALAVAFPAAAQEIPVKPGEIQEVVITASKRKESIQTVAMSVDALTAESLQKLNVQQFADVEKLSPGMQLDSADGRGQSVALRGVTFNPDTGASPTVQIYWNETPISTSDAFRSLFDIGRIEVLRGPQGTLRGQTSPAGAITVATRVPSLTGVEGTINQTWGSHRLWNTQAAVNVPLIEGKLAMRVAGVYNRSEGDVHNVSNGATTTTARVADACPCCTSRCRNWKSCSCTSSSPTRPSTIRSTWVRRWRGRAAARV